jgi:hypothetical protein
MLRSAVSSDGESDRIASQQAIWVQDLAQKATATAIEGDQVDGDNVVAVRNAAAETLEIARVGGGAADDRSTDLPAARAVGRRGSPRTRSIWGVSAASRLARTRSVHRITSPAAGALQP